MPPASVSYLVGGPNPAARPLPPYHPAACDFLAELSSALRASKETSAHPDVMAFAFWCRKANLDALKKKFDDGRLRLGLGLAFHVAPANVPINFAFSYAFGLLAGNANLVRVPSRSFPQVDLVCRAASRLLEKKRHAEIKAMTAFVRYEADDAVTAELLRGCGARLIWGGDETIRRIRALAGPVRAVEIAFADRYSFCLLDAGAVVRLDKAGLKRLAEGFYNDAFLMDQAACSSPHLVVWRGRKAAAAQERFWTAAAAVAAAKYRLPPAGAVDKFALLCRDAIERNNVKYARRHGNHAYRVGLSSLPPDLDALRGRRGYFYEYETADLSDVAAVVNDKYQTLTYFGLSRTELSDFVVGGRLPGIDRVVPVGRALDMGPVWDGYDVIKTLSRIVDVS